MSDISPSANTDCDILSPSPGGPVALDAAVPVSPEEQARRSAEQEQRSVRVWCTFIFAICAGMLLLAAWLTPANEGMETHRQLGLPPCGFYTVTGIPCPTCGCTTSVSHFAHGHFLASFLTHPFGFAVALLAALLTPLAAYGMVKGKWIGPSTFWIAWHWRTWIYGGIAVLVVGWVYKIYLVKAHIHLP